MHIKTSRNIAENLEWLGVIRRKGRLGNRDVEMLRAGGEVISEPARPEAQSRSQVREIPGGCRFPENRLGLGDETSAVIALY